MSDTQKPNGYARLASLMGPNPEVAIFRRFSTLNDQNLLLLQAELVHLENQLKRCAKADEGSGHPERTIYDRDWQTLIESAEKPDGNPEQWYTILTIREKLKEYNETLLLQIMLSKEGCPVSQDLKFLQTWMSRPSMGYVYLLGSDSDIYEKPDVSDLISIGNRKGQSLIFRATGDLVVYWWHRCFGKDIKGVTESVYANTIRYSNNSLARIGIVIGTICASTLPVLAIVVLYLVTDMAHRLALVATFTALFSAVLGTFSNCRGIEIFSATASFAAVQVVFIGTTSNSKIGDGNI